ncbi:MAG: thymidine phosphorylase [Acidimicrobiia bacterium]
MSFSVVELIRLKRDGDALPPEAVKWIISEYTASRIPDYQISALLMAILFNGMEHSELGRWTDAMLHSGETLDLSSVPLPKVDKHSTGGVGDKISIPLAPVVAACGLAVPMISGRGLGHTGGTLDKLEAIPGFSTEIAPHEFPAQLNDIGVVMAGQTATLVPADQRLYALRDATGTVPSVPLISSSIMSKKLAEDLDGLLLDVKVGSGAFMKTSEEATHLAKMMVGIGRGRGTPVTAVLTDMSQPLGRAVGNANEITESVATLRGEGPEDVRELTLRFAAEMIMLSGDANPEDARTLAEQAVSSGAALEHFVRLVERQGGDPSFVDDASVLESAPNEYVVETDRTGYLARCDALSIGNAAVRLGAGRATKESEIDSSVGIMLEAKVGDQVVAGEPLARISYRDETSLDSALGALREAWEITEEEPATPDLVIGAIV